MDAFRDCRCRNGRRKDGIVAEDGAGIGWVSRGISRGGILENVVGVGLVVPAAQNRPEQERVLSGIGGWLWLRRSEASMEFMRGTHLYQAIKVEASRECQGPMRASIVSICLV